MGWLERFRGRGDETALALYRAVVREGRAPHWYVAGGVPDTLDGRFDAIATVLAVTILRLEREPGGGAAAARLTERFVDDMDGQAREIGIGDLTVGKHVGRMMALLGGRLGAFRDALGGGDFDAALLRALYRGAHPGDTELAHARTALTAWRDRLDAASLPELLAGGVA